MIDWRFNTQKKRTLIAIDEVIKELRAWRLEKSTRFQGVIITITESRGARYAAM